MALRAPTGPGVLLLSPSAMLDQARPSSAGSNVVDIQQMLQLKSQYDSQMKSMQAQGQIPLPSEPTYLTRRGRGSFIPDQTQNILSSLLSF